MENPGRMPWIWRREVALCLLLVTSIPALAVAPDYWGLDLEFDAVGGIHHLGDPYFSASGVAIGPRHALTARHVGGTRFTVAGEMHTWIQRHNHPVYDLSVLEFGEDLPTWIRIADSSTVGATLTMVGYGGTGWVNAAGDGYDIDPTRDSTRRKANSALDFKWRDPNSDVPHLMSYLVEDGCAVAVGGDSGGGWFIDGELVGVTSAFFSTNQNLPYYGFASQNGGVPYFGTAAIDLTDPSVKDWLATIVWAGDLDGDGDVDQLDLGILLAAYLINGNGDLDGDGDTDQADLGILLANYGRGA